MPTFRRFNKSKGNLRTMWTLASGLPGRVAIVTGAGGGIGSACLRALESAGSLVVACDLDRPRLETAVALLDGERPHLAIVADLARAEEVDRLVEQTLSAFGRLDILVHAAAVHLRLHWERIDEPAWQKYVDANLKSAFLLSRAVAVPMRASGWGRIIHFTSLAAFTGGFQPETSVAYAATKGAVLTMTRSLARLLASDNILVNAVAPGGVLTPMAASLRPEALDAYASAVPLGRLATPAEIANVVLFLASDHASYITGAVIDVNGGAFPR